MDTPTTISGPVGIKYIGDREVHEDNLYGTCLRWSPGQVHNVKSNVAEKMLQHTDVYQGCSLIPGDVAIGDQQPADGEPAQQQAYALPHLEGMDKDALATFSQQHFGEKLPKTMKEDTMRQRILGLIQERGLR